MKKMLCFLLFVMSFVGFSQESKEFPKELWEEIIELRHNENFSFGKWNKDINIGIDGNYNLKDSLSLLKIAKKIDSLTETVNVKLTRSEDSNFNIRFLSEKKYKSRSTNNKKRNFEYVELIVDKKSEWVDLNQNLEKRILRSLISGRFEQKKYSNKKRSNSIYELSPVVYFEETPESLHIDKEDLNIIKEVYSKGFEKRLQKAEKEFAYVLDEIKAKKIKARDRSLWWVKYPESVMILPLLLVIIMFLWCIKKIHTTLIYKIKHHLVRFTILSLVILCCIGILIVLGVSCYDYLTIPDDYDKVSFFRHDTVITTFFSLLCIFPFLFLFRFVESKIQNNFHSIYVKTGLIFLSTAFIPFICLLVFSFLVSYIEYKSYLTNQMFEGVIKVFTYLILIASSRALLSFFHFKENNLIIENERQMSHLRELKTQAELKSLQSQINPHFLYNSLNSIASLAPVDAVKTQKMAHSLSDLFKYSINRKGKKMSTVQEEINMVNSYLQIEKIRFGDRLQFKIEVETSILKHEIPLFLIQPLVENAIKHGISKNKNQGEIILKIEEKEQQLCISVFDNGPDFSDGLVSGHGLQTVYDLLRLSYQDQAILNWTNEPQKMIQITIPQNL